MKRGLLALAWAVAAAAALAPRVSAMPADDTPAAYRQPDGATVTLRSRGDEWFHWREDLEGYTVVQERGEWRYAALDPNERLVPTPHVVGRANPAALGFSRRVLPSREVRLRGRGAPTADGSLASYRQEIAPTGLVKNLVILCLFSDHTVAANARNPSAYDSLFNQVGSTGLNAPTGSVRDYWAYASYNNLVIQSTVTAWVTLPQTEAYYGNGLNGLPFANGSDPASPYPNNAVRMVEDALAAADASVNFADFDQDNDGFVDAITIIHSGYGGEAAGASANSIWSHRYALSSRSGGSAWTSADKNANNVNVKVDPYHTEPALWGTAGLAPTRIGVIAHELGHFFGLPDLYDTDVSNGGIGNWCLMANSWGWDQSQRYPPLPSAWCRDQLGWVTLLVPSGPGTVTVPAVAVTPQVWYITRGFPAGEYLLIENRQAVGFDQQIPQGGLAIWHIDENAPGNMNEGFPGQSGWPGNGNHFRVALLQADGNYDLEQYATTNNRGDAGDLYQNVPSIALDETTVPNCDAYQGGAVYPTGIQISNVSPSSASMTFTYRPGVWVDFAWNGTQTGTFAQPFKTVSGGMSAAGPGGAVIFKAGSSPATGTFGTSSTPSYWRPWTGTVTIGQ